VADPALALDFDEIEHAGRLAFQEGVAQLEVVLVNGDSKCKLALPIRRARPARREWRGEREVRVAAQGV